MVKPRFLATRAPPNVLPVTDLSRGKPLRGKPLDRGHFITEGLTAQADLSFDVRQDKAVRFIEEIPHDRSNPDDFRADIGKITCECGGQLPGMTTALTAEGLSLRSSVSGAIRVLLIADFPGYHGVSLSDLPV